MLLLYPGIWSALNSCSLPCVNAFTHIKKRELGLDRRDSFTILNTVMLGSDGSEICQNLGLECCVA